jgi:hypothetical protein
MQYLLLIYEREEQWDTVKDAEKQQVLQQFVTLVDGLKKSGNLLGGNRLQPTATATTIRVREGKNLVTDGPFAETKEQLGGYFLVEAKDLDEATAIAERIPSAKWGSIEVRPVVMRQG